MSSFTVNSIEDGEDANTGDGLCNDGTGSCTLRAAIEQANANPGIDTIGFDIPGAGPHTIRPAQVLPQITDPIVIAGYTQPGASPNTNGPGLGSNAVVMIELHRTATSVIVIGLRISAGNSTVRGLTITSFSDGIRLSDIGGNVIEGNFIGTDVTGTTDIRQDPRGPSLPLIRLGNSNGVLIESSNNIIGGTSPGARNVISSNGNAGMIISGGDATDNRVQGNFIGTDVTGSAVLGNRDGVIIVSSNNTIGGGTAGARNVISGNDNAGLNLAGSANLVWGNVISRNNIGVLSPVAGIR